MELGYCSVFKEELETLRSRCLDGCLLLPHQSWQLTTGIRTGFTFSQRKGIKHQLGTFGHMIIYFFKDSNFLPKVLLKNTQDAALVLLSTVGRSEVKRSP